MKLSEKYRPKFLSEVCGQPEVRKLQGFVRNPYPSCWLLESGPGTGKTSCAYALAADLGCTDDWSGLHTVVASRFGVDEASKMFFQTLPLRPMQGRGWKVLVIEELEYLSPSCVNVLKVALEHQLPAKTVVVATSNDTTKLPVALYERFTVLYFNSGPEFAEASQDTLLEIWAEESGNAPLPACWSSWGWYGNDSFSFRRALDEMQQELLAVGPVVMA